MNKLCLLLLILLCSTSFCLAEGAIVFDNYQAPDPNQSVIIYDANKNTATLIVMRTSGIIGGTVTLSSPLFINGLLVDALRYEQYTSCEVPSGRVKLSSHNTLHYNEIYLDVIEGETYYINFYMVLKGGSVAAPRFEVLDKDVAIERLKKCKKTEYPIE